MLGRLVQYDGYERHRAVAHLLEEQDGSRILDVGGVRGMLARHLPSASVLTLNVDKSADVQYAGPAFPFATAAFDVVVSLDTLEHIRWELRGRFLEECVRVARSAVLVAAPLGSPGHAACEARLDALYRQAHGSFNRWLHEHILYGLPNEADLTSWKVLLAEGGFAAQIWYAGDYRWQCRHMERSVWLVRRLGFLGRLASLLNLMPSLAVWHPVVLGEQPSPCTNRFYLFGTRARWDRARNRDTGMGLRSVRDTRNPDRD